MSTRDILYIETVILLLVIGPPTTYTSIIFEVFAAFHMPVGLGTNTRHP